MRKGVPVSPGVAVAKALRLDEVTPSLESSELPPGISSEEIRRLDRACTTSIQELDTIIVRVTRQIGEEEAAIFRAHRLLSTDPAFIAKVKEAIVDRHLNAETALRESLAEYTVLFSELQDAYLRERLADIRDVVRRILVHLRRTGSRSHPELSEPVILVAEEVLPSDVIAWAELPVAGVVTETGGATGHAAILARSLGIPAVTGLPGILQEVQTGDIVVLDGREGHVYLRPGAELEAAYRTLQREHVNLRDRLIENRDQKPLTADGIRVELLANVNGPADAVMAHRVGACGVGLYRTEYLFLAHPGVPDEEEQLAVYRAVIEAAPNRTVTIRTLDLGGDKQLPYLGKHREANPALGWRSTRLLLDHPRFFETQLRAILRAAPLGQVNLLVPMITTLEEVREVKRALDRVRSTMPGRPEGFDRDTPLGIMLEVPAVAVCLEDLLQEVDFVSIGSNDLIQYLMAADRNNPQVAHFCEPFSPAIFRVLHRIIKACLEHHTPVTLCGEMAGRLRCFLPLLGMGLRSFSMSPAFIPALKDLVRHTSQPMVQEIAAQVLQMKTAQEIREYLTRTIH
ncbi:MAG: phosphoenolpyruvate--protein phosphotransferase, partial [Planctomycetota bacterium]|nr:phosphoenolpyruvate--protein phosphotransferase [Planctomycetota bacterium]